MVEIRRWSWMLALGVLLGVPAPSRADVKEGRAALQRGDWKAAAAAFTGAPSPEAAPAALALAETYLVTGRPAEALAAAKRAAASPAEKSEALRLEGQAYRDTGKLEEAKQALSAALRASAANSHARLDLGRLYLQAGQKALMGQTLQWFLDGFSRGDYEKAGAPALTDLAGAARCLELWQDANEMYRQASEKDPAYLRAGLEWGDLFLEKYRPGEAQKSFEQVLKINPHQPDALLGLARVKLTGQYDVIGATRLADRALAENPRLVPALNLKAGLFLDNQEYTRAEALLRQALAANPAHLETQALLAASRYLQDDKAGYEALRKAVLKQNPHYGDFYVQVSEYAVKEHRYQEAIDLNNQAIAIDPQNERALVALGSGYLRMGLEAKGLAQLRKAWDRDPFNVMNYNLLTLFEEVIPKEYVTVSSGNFRFTMNKKEAPVLSLYVPALMQQAWDVFVRKYGFTPKNPITVELFTERQHYGVRTVGLPELDAQGTCFGELITAMSPASGEADWEEVLWHELSHVFAIQLSHNRVPRWFTEGLSEYETNVARPEWKREHNRELYLSLKRGDLWSIPDLNAAFTRPDRPNGVVIAYHQASLVIHYLAETYGFDKILAALKLYAQGKRDAQVIPAITGKSVSETDADFRRWLLKRFDCYEKGLLIDWQRFADGAKWKETAAAHPADAAVQAGYAASLYVAKDAAGARGAAEKALALDAREPLALYVLGQVALEAKDYKSARPRFEALVAAGKDGYAAQMALGEISAAEGDRDAAVRHYDAAKPFDPDRGEPYQLAAALYRSMKRDADAIAEMRGYTRIEEHERDAARELFDREVATKDMAGIISAAPPLIAIQPMEYYVHEQYGAALAASDRRPEAVREFTAALASSPRKPAPIHVELARCYQAMGDRAKARAAAEAAVKEDPGNVEAAALLKELQ